MLLSDLVILLRLKGYEYKEEQNEDGILVYAEKGLGFISLGVKELILKSDINFFVRSEAYQKLV